jgi:hypothetical protein
MITLELIGGEALVEWPLLGPLPQYSHQLKDHAPADTHRAPAVFVLERFPIQQVRIPPSLGLLAGPPAFGFRRAWMHLSALVLVGQRFAIVPPAGNEEEIDHQCSWAFVSLTESRF